MKKDWVILAAVVGLVFLLALAIITTKKPRVEKELAEELELLQQTGRLPLKKTEEGLEELPRPPGEEAPEQRTTTEIQKQMGLPGLSKEVEFPEGVTLPPGKKKLPQPPPATKEEFETKESEVREEPSLKELENLFSEELEHLMKPPEEGEGIPEEGEGIFEEEEGIPEEGEWFPEEGAQEE